MSQPSDDPGRSTGSETAARWLLHDANFRRYITIRWFTTFGIQILIVSVGWQVYDITSDPLDLGFIGLSQFSPILLFFLPAGLAADRLSRRAILCICNAVHLAVAAFLLIYALSDPSAVWPIFLVLFVNGIARAFFSPSQTSILANIVARERFASGVAYSTSVSKAGHLAAPAIAGVLIALIGMWVYLIALVSFAIALSAAFLLAVRRASEPPRSIGLTMLVGGFVYVWTNKLVLATMSMDLVAVLFSGILGMLPVFARDVLHVGPEGLGVMRAMPAAGAVVIGLLLAQFPLKGHVGRTLVLSVIVVGLASSTFAVSDVFALSLLALLVFGAADMVSTNIRQTLVQLVTPDNMRGRVSSVHSLTSNASNEIGDFRAGAMAALIGTVPAVFIGGMVTVALSVLWWRVFPELRKVDRVQDARVAH